MTIDDVLRERRDSIVKQWLETIYATYPFDTTGFLRSRKNQFANPVGHATEAAVEAMFDAICGADLPEGKLEGALADLIRVRAIQQFTPEQATGIIFCVKPLLRQSLMAALREPGILEAYLEMESRVDTLSLLAFRMYAEDRERMHMLKVDEYKRRYAQLIRRAEMIVEGPAGDPE